MKVVSWNLLCNNKRQVKSLSYVMQKLPEVVCLQEVSEETVRFLREQQAYQVFVAKDFRKKKLGKTIEYYLVILVKKNIRVKAHHIRHIPHITRNSFWDRIMRWTETLDFHWVDIEIEGQKYQVTNIHLEVGAGPHLRKQQFDHVLSCRDEKSSLIVCGDFNLFGRWYVSPVIGWGMGFKLPELFLNERSMFEQLFVEYGLQNVFRNQVTFPFFRLQLDHILVDKRLTVGSTFVYPYTFFSDHRPLELEIVKKKKSN